MRRALGRLGGCLILAVAIPAYAQVPDTPADAPPSSQTPAAPQTPTAPAAQAPAAAATGGPLSESDQSLFAPVWNTLQLSGRASSVDGDTARFQRYEDLRNGLLFTGARLKRETPDWFLTAGADNVGWRDQRFGGNYERIGRFKVTGFWDQIPQFYSIDTKTAFVSQGEGVLVLDNAAQAQANRNAYLNISPQFDLKERRDIGAVRFAATPTTKVDITGGFTSTKHSGELPWGADFGFSNDNEVALPYNSRTNDFDLGASWTNQRSMIRAAYTGSWFDNIDSTLLWDNPLVLNDSTSAPGHGRTALWPSNSLQTLSVSGYEKFEHKSQLTGSLSFGWWNNDEALLPFTVNSALPQIALPRATAEAAANTISTNVGFVSRPRDDWRFSARWRLYDYNNNTPETSITQYISYDTSVSTTPTGGPDLFAHSRNTVDGDATWTGAQPFALTFGYTNNHTGYNERTFESTNENVLRLQADAVGTAWLTFRAHYEYGSRGGSGLDEASLLAIGEYAAMRHYDLADRTRNRFTGQVDITPTEALTLSASVGTLNDKFPNSYFGVQESAGRTVSFSGDYQMPSGFVGGATYNYERYTGLQRSRSAGDPVQQADPNRDWLADTKETVHFVSFYVQSPRIRENTEVRFSYDYAHARGNIVYDVGSALPKPSQLPQTFNKLTDLRIEARHRLTGRLAATGSYVYEPYSIFDFAFDPTVIDSIVQPSSLVLGYTYRPYTAHTFLFGVQYYW